MLDADHLVLIGRPVIGQQPVQTEQQRHANARLQIDRPIQSSENRDLLPGS